MSTTIVNSNDLSKAWKESLRLLTAAIGSNISPFLYSIEIENGFEPINPKLIQVIDPFLRVKKIPSTHTTANTIFPLSYWNPKLPRRILYERFIRMWPRIKKCPPNRYGHYFQRLIANELGIDDHKGRPTNQLEMIIANLLRGNTRRSALQASIFIPKKDLTHNRQRGFPCLQHVFFTPLSGSRLSITGVYATQYLIFRGYGNLIGLYNLGQFVAKATNLKLTNLECFVSSLKLGVGISKDAANKLLEKAGK